jgi:hypothetical protein
MWIHAFIWPAVDFRSGKTLNTPKPTWSRAHLMAHHTLTDCRIRGIDSGGLPACREAMAKGPDMDKQLEATRRGQLTVTMAKVDDGDFLRWSFQHFERISVRQCETSSCYGKSVWRAQFSPTHSPTILILILIFILNYRDHRDRDPVLRCAPTLTPREDAIDASDAGRCIIYITL